MRPGGEQEAHVAAELTVQVEPFGSDQSVHDGVVAGLFASGALEGDGGQGDYRLIGLRLVEPARKTARPRERDRYRATFYDYKRNRALHAEGPLDDPSRADVSVTQRQPRPSPDEFGEAVKIVRRDKELGAAVRRGALVPYPPM